MKLCKINRQEAHFSVIIEVMRAKSSKIQETGEYLCRDVDLLLLANNKISESDKRLRERGTGKR